MFLMTVTPGKSSRKEDATDSELDHHVTGSLGQQFRSGRVKVSGSDPSLDPVVEF